MYTLGFVLCLLGVWAVNIERKGLENLGYLLLPGLALWLFGLAAQTDTLTVFFQASFLDLIFLGGAAMLFRALARFTRWGVPAGLAALLLMAGLHENRKLHEAPSQDAGEITTPAAPLNRIAAEAELLVELNDEDMFERWKRWIGAQGWTTERAFAPADGARTDLDDYWTVNLPAAQVADLDAIMAAIEATGWVDWVEPNEIIQIEPLPARTLPKLNAKLGVNDPAVAQQWALEALQMDKLYALLNEDGIRPAKRALVAILDTGVDAAHEDLRDNFLSINKKHDTDAQGHGTHCAGIAGAVTNNGIGVASYARSNEFFRISSVRVLRAGGSGTQQDIIQGIIEAADAGADVLSMSLGGFSTQSRQRAYSEAVRYATDAGAIVVASAGNSNRDAAGFSPVNATGVIGVSAIDHELQRADFSNRVNNLRMAVAAPGVGIYSTKPDNNYAAHNGTSMAAPYVSGLLGIMKSIRPDLSHKEAFKILEATGRATRDTPGTGKLIDPAAAVRKTVEGGGERSEVGNF